MVTGCRSAQTSWTSEANGPPGTSFFEWPWPPCMHMHDNVYELYNNPILILLNVPTVGVTVSDLQREGRKAPHAGV